jgi:hypothetical protein
MTVLCSAEFNSSHREGGSGMVWRDVVGLLLLLILRMGFLNSFGVCEADRDTFLFDS